MQIGCMELIINVLSDVTLCDLSQQEDVKPKDDFSHLPPTQQKRELQKKIDDIQGQIDQEMKSK